MSPHSPSILLVEDDPNDVTLFTRALRKVLPDSLLSVARDGDEAVEFLSKVRTAAVQEAGTAPTVVILDLKLPKRSGLEVLEWIQGRRELHRHRLVVLSSSEEPKDLERAFRAGLEEYHVKPPNFTELVEVLRKILKP